VKPHLVLGHRNYHARHEGIYHGHGPGGNGGRATAGRFRWHGADNATTVFEYPSPAASREHPTMKPVELIVPMLLNSSLPDEIVLDLFAGSGSTMAAAVATGRRAFMVELDPRYCDVIRHRWQTLAHPESSPAGSPITP
jgi:site-specific DNA-methyltransferase (adenine-specific)